MLNDEIRKSTGRKKNTAASDIFTDVHGSSSGIGNTAELLNELSLIKRGSHAKQISTGAASIPVRSYGSSVPTTFGFTGSNELLSHSMPTGPVIGSLPGPAIGGDMPALNLAPATSSNTADRYKEAGDDDFQSRSLIKAINGFHIPVKKSFVRYNSKRYP